MKIGRVYAAPWTCCFERDPQSPGQPVTGGPFAQVTAPHHQADLGDTEAHGARIVGTSASSIFRVKCTFRGSFSTPDRLPGCERSGSQRAGTPPRWCQQRVLVFTQQPPWAAGGLEVRKMQAAFVFKILSSLVATSVPPNDFNSLKGQESLARFPLRGAVGF